MIKYADRLPQKENGLFLEFFNKFVVYINKALSHLALYMLADNQLFSRKGTMLVLLQVMDIIKPTEGVIKP